MVMTTLTERFDRALVYARERHSGQHRKSTEIPYLAHLMSTAALVLEAGGGEDQAIAGLLHDSLEDCEYTETTYAELVEIFGDRVARIVRDAQMPSHRKVPTKRHGDRAKRRTSPAWTITPPTPSWSPTPTSSTTPGRSWPTTGSTARTCGRGSILTAISSGTTDPWPTRISGSIRPLPKSSTE